MLPGKTRTRSRQPDRAAGFRIWSAGSALNERQQEGLEMEEIWARFVENMAGRVSGPMKLRLLFQPLMAVFFAVRAGLNDAKSGRPTFFWALAHSPELRDEKLKQAGRSAGKVFVLAMALDVVYQFVELRTVYPGEAIIVAFVLAILPYLLVRPAVGRLARRGRKAGPAA
jgi:hypothetical protein